MTITAQQAKYFMSQKYEKLKSLLKELAKVVAGVQPADV